MTDQARTMFKALLKELGLHLARCPLDQSLGRVFDAVQIALLEADMRDYANANEHGIAPTAAPSNEGAGVAGASVSRPTLEEAEKWLRWHKDEVQQGSLPPYAAVLIKELERLRNLSGSGYNRCHDAAELIEAQQAEIVRLMAVTTEQAYRENNAECMHCGHSLFNVVEIDEANAERAALRARVAELEQHAEAMADTLEKETVCTEECQCAMRLSVATYRAWKEQQK